MKNIKEKNNNKNKGTAKTKKKSGSLTMLRRMIFGGRKADLDVMSEEQVQGPIRTILKNFKSNKIAMIGVYVFILIILCCFVLPFIFPANVKNLDSTQQNLSPNMSYLNIPDELQGNIQDISAGSSFSVGCDKNGKVYIWGDTKPYGVLKDLITEEKPSDAKLGKVIKVAAGLTQIVTLNQNGVVNTWGYNQFDLDQLPQDLKIAQMKGIKIVDIIAGYQVSMALSEEGQVFIWGNQNIFNAYPNMNETEIGAFTKYKKIAMNMETAFGITEDNDAVCMSSTDTPFRNIPEEVSGHVIDITACDSLAGCVTDDGKVYIWGRYSSEYKIPDAIQGKAVNIEAGRRHFTVLLNDGSVVSWGENYNGQCNYPVSLKGADDIASGFYQNYAFMENGTAQPWGLKGYLIGTDQYGRDLFSRLIKGGQITLTIGALSVIISAIIGIIIGGFAGYYGGVVDMILMRSAEIVNAIPFLPLAIILSSLVSDKMTELGRIAMIMIILGVLSWPSMAWLVRSQILAEREKEFVTAAKAMGIKEISIIFKHILPNVFTVLLVNLTLGFATCMLTESSLSYLGFGVKEPSPTWGNMLSGSISTTVLTKYWWRWIFPAISLSIATISINLAGDGMREAIDPKSNDR